MNGFIRFLTAMAATAVLMAGAAGAPALAEGMADDSACVMAGLAGEEFGLCNAYCEAMDCDGDNPQASAKACEKVRTKFEAIAFDPELPCLVPDGTNAAPVVDLNGPLDGIDTTATFVSFGDGVPIAVDVVITDDDGDVIVSATVTLTNPLVGVEETLSLTPAGDSLVTNDLALGDWDFDSTSGVLTITGTGDKATYALILLEVVYDNALDTPNTTTRDVEVSVNDGTDTSLLAAISVMATEVGCPCASFSSDLAVSPAILAMFRQRPTADTGACVKDLTVQDNGINLDTVFDVDLGIFDGSDGNIHDAGSRFWHMATLLLSGGEGSCFLFETVTEQGLFQLTFLSDFVKFVPLTVEIFQNQRGTPLFNLPPWQRISEYTPAMNDACRALIPVQNQRLAARWAARGIPACSAAQ